MLPRHHPHLPLVTFRLRAPKSPDATADIGHHQFTYAVMPHQGERWAELSPHGVEDVLVSLQVSTPLAAGSGFWCYRFLPGRRCDPACLQLEFPSPRGAGQLRAVPGLERLFPQLTCCRAGDAQAGESPGQQRVKLLLLSTVCSFPCDWVGGQAIPQGVGEDALVSCV